MTTFAKTGSALLALTMAVTAHATTITSSVIGAAKTTSAILSTAAVTSLASVAITTPAQAKRTREQRQLDREARKAARAFRKYQKSIGAYDRNEPEYESPTGASGGTDDAENGGYTGGVNNGASYEGD